jgi:hypothetical protein
MVTRDISDDLRKEAARALEGFRDGSETFTDYTFGVAIPYQLEFDEWISDIEDYLDVAPIELKGNNLVLTIKRFFPTVDCMRLRHLIANPKLITEDESLEWRRVLYQDDQYADFLVLVPLRLQSAEIGAAIIRDQSNIPGGEFDLDAVFASVEEGEQYLKRYCF